MLAQQQRFFEMLNNEKFTTLTIQLESEQRVQLTMLREWSHKVTWQGKNSRGILKRPKRLVNAEVTRLIAQYNLENVLDQTLAILRHGRHESLTLVYDSFVNRAGCVIAMHHTRKQYLVGGIRRFFMTNSEQEVINEVLHLSREMTYRCTAGKLPCGGAYLGFQAPLPKPDNVDALTGFLGYVCNHYPVKWGIETGFSEEEISGIDHHVTHVTDTREKSDLITAAAAYSIYCAVREAIRYRYGSEIKGKQIGIQGLGRVGSRIADILLQQGADIIVTDMNPKQIETFLKRYPDAEGKTLNSVSVGEIRMQMGHVFVPCACSGNLNRDSIRELHYHIVVGGANRLLQADSISEEIFLANRLQKQGILYLPNWIANIGAVICATALLLSETPPDQEQLHRQIETVCTPLIQKILQQSKAKGISPLELAYQKLDASIYH